jgi:hypothetical protein
MTAPTLQQVNADLARALGVVDLSDVQKVTLTLDPGELPRVHVERIVLPGSAAAKVHDALSTVSFVHHLEPTEPKEVK